MVVDLLATTCNHQKCDIRSLKQAPTEATNSSNITQSISLSHRHAGLGTAADHSVSKCCLSSPDFQNGDIPAHTACKQ